MRNIDRDEPVYMIGVVSKICELHPQTLRMYERLGLISPRRVKSKNRMYSESDIERLRQIQRLTQDMGVNLAGVEIILNLLDRIKQLQQEMDESIRVRNEIENKLKELLNKQ